MKVVVYSIKNYEKEFIAKANQKKHDITLIANTLNEDTANFAQGKDAVIVFTNDDVSANVVAKLQSYGIKYIATRSTGTDHIDRVAATAAGMKIANVPNYSPQSIAEHALTLIMALNRKVNLAYNQTKNFDFQLNNLQGFCLKDKIVGLIGFGNIAKSLAQILKGFGCQILVHDPYLNQFPNYVTPVSLETLYSHSRIISLHTPLTAETRYIINQNAINQMQNGVMLINTGRGALVNTNDIIEALQNGKIGYYGADVYEKEHNLFFEDHQSDEHKDPLLQELMSLPNVIITPHQAFFTQEALQEIANKTIQNIDNWQKGKCVGKACACANSCQKELVAVINNH
jgi:D-lactate dehydrogenase